MPTRPAFVMMLQVAALSSAACARHRGGPPHTPAGATRHGDAGLAMARPGARSVASDLGIAEAAAPAIEPLPRGTTVLQIGDSMADALGKPLREELSKEGVRVINEVKTGSHIPLWGGRFSNVPHLVKRHQPDLVVINLGGNDLLVADRESRVEPVRRLVQYVEGRPCVWIAPPLWPKADTGMLELIREHAHPCRWFDTNVVTPNLDRERGDPIHPAPPARRVWAKAFIGWLARERDPEGTHPFTLRPGGPVDDYDPYAE